jgi:allantoinase
MPLNSSPPTLDGASFDLKRRAAEASSRTDFALWGGLTPGNLDQLEELAEQGVVGFKAFMANSGIEDFAAADDYTLYRGMQIAAKLGLIVAVHAENDAITSGLAAAARREGRVGMADYLRSRPDVAEVEAIRRAVSLASETKCRLHIVHVSSREGSWAAHIGCQYADVTYETCPHYFVLTEEDLPRLGAAAKCAPPLRTADDAEHLRFMLSTGEITFVASDHSPSPPSMKRGNNFFDVWGGIAGVQTTLAAMLGIEPPLPLGSVAAYTASNVARRFDIPAKGKMAVGQDADLALVDLWEYFELTRDMLLDRHKLSPYVGRMFHGMVKRTLVRGHTVFQDGKTVGEFRGRLVTPSRKGEARG